MATTDRDDLTLSKKEMAMESEVNTDTRLMILNDSDLMGCSYCHTPFPADFPINATWYADIVWYGPDEGRAEATCPACLQGAK